MSPGQIVILNGAPRSGKSSIARAIQASLPGVWLNLGVDAMAAMTPEQYRPGIGLRPGGERPDLEPVVTELYAALYEAIAAVARTGVNVVSDIGHHESYSRPTQILRDCARRLAGLPVLFVGVSAPIETILARRATSEGSYIRGSAEDAVPAPVARWQDTVHAHGTYDLMLDTSQLTPSECAEIIRETIAHPFALSAFERIGSA
ncbi:MAG TPA: chloramphenicol phosphotransferase [Bauldia sp.]|nr:chloramphenicol phosphotransferase [Bauldia sp.]